MIKPSHRLPRRPPHLKPIYVPRPPRWGSTSVDFNVKKEDGWSNGAETFKIDVVPAKDVAAEKKRIKKQGENHIAIKQGTVAKVVVSGYDDDVDDAAELYRIVSLPIGKYRLNYWTVERKDDRGRAWKLKGSGTSARSSFEIKHEKQTKLAVGEPAISLVSARKLNSAFSFSHELKGQLDEHIELTRQGGQPQAPKLRIENEDGTFDRTYSFAYGGGGTCSLSWREPKNVTGPFTATVDIDGPFKFESKPYTIGETVTAATP